MDAIVVNQSDRGGSLASVHQNPTIAMRLEPGRVHDLADQQPWEIQDWIQRNRGRTVELDLASGKMMVYCARDGEKVLL